MSHTQLPDYGAVLAEVREVRRAGIVRLRELGIPVLTGLSAGPGEGSPGGPHFPAVERLLRTAVASMGGGTLQEAAEYSLGLARGTRDWPPADRRRRAAQVYGVSVERFRKHHELMVLGQVAEQVVRHAGGPRPSAEPTTEEVGRQRPDIASATGSTGRQLPAGHHRIPVRIGGRDHRITLHVHAVDLLRDIDVVVSPSNTHFALPEPYKSSVAASLRRTAALRDPAGRIVAEPVRDELRAWTDRYAPQGLPVAPGTVAVTGAGALERQGVRYIHHAAVAVPRPGTNDYDVQPVDVTRAVTRVFALLGEARAGNEDRARTEDGERVETRAEAEARAEAAARAEAEVRVAGGVAARVAVGARSAFGAGTVATPAPPTSVCLPLLGAGRGGLGPAESLAAVWAAVEAELARGAGWDIHLVVRSHERAQLVRELLGPPAADTAAGGPTGGARPR
ncbi:MULTISPECIES: hypothetical protein [unclassified Streptomyces]|uniref:hypothetical protein n=1 Tax=unclassified Streptomyces TaxID=2593676 RepID=UPI0036511D59